MSRSKSKNGIALMITLFFIMAITIAIGISLKQVNDASAHVESEKLLLQTSMIFDDVLTMLKSAKELDYLSENNVSGDEFGVFLDSFSIPGIPLGNTGIIIAVELKSARSKFNPNTLMENNQTLNELKIELLQTYLNSYMVDSTYIDMLLDGSSKVKIDGSYRTGLFYDKPYLFRDYIASQEHLEEINDFYMKSYHDSNLKKINFENLFYYAKYREPYKVDLNCAKTDVLEMFLGDKNRALSLVPLESIGCSSIVCTSLSDDEKTMLESYGATCNVQLYLDVAVEVMQNGVSSKINFEYDLAKKKGYNFSYEI